MSRGKKDPQELLEEVLRRNKETKARLEEDKIGDEIDHLQKERIIREIERDRETNKFRAQKSYEKKEREHMGASAWFDLNDKRIKEKEKEKEEIEQDTLWHDTQYRKELREMKRDDQKEMWKRQSEYEKMRQQWREDDERRARERALDEKNQREESWRKQEYRRAQIKREREEYRKEAEKNERERELERRIEENRRKAKEARDHSATTDLETIQRRKLHEKRSKDLALERTEHFEELNATKNAYDLELKYGVLSHTTTPDRYKRNLKNRHNRLYEDETSLENVRKWYSERDYNRGERRRNALNAIHSY